MTPSGNSGHVVVPKVWIGKEAIVTLKGNSGHVVVPKVWIGKEAIVTLKEESKGKAKKK